MDKLICMHCGKVFSEDDAGRDYYTYGADADGNGGELRADLVCPSCGDDEVEEAAKCTAEGCEKYVARSDYKRDDCPLCEQHAAELAKWWDTIDRELISTFGVEAVDWHMGRI